MKYSRATSIVSSAYKRHGRILETALRESLRESNRHKVWQEDAFKVSRAADALVGSRDGASDARIGQSKIFIATRPRTSASLQKRTSERFRFVPLATEYS